MKMRQTALEQCVDHMHNKLKPKHKEAEQSTAPILKVPPETQLDQTSPPLKLPSTVSSNLPDTTACAALLSITTGTKQKRGRARGHTLPPVDFLAVCLVRAMFLGSWTELGGERTCAPKLHYTPYQLGMELRLGSIEIYNII